MCLSLSALRQMTTFFCLACLRTATVVQCTIGMQTCPLSRQQRVDSMPRSQNGSCSDWLLVRHLMYSPDTVQARWQLSPQWSDTRARLSEHGGDAGTCHRLHIDTRTVPGDSVPQRQSRAVTKGQGATLPFGVVQGRGQGGRICGSLPTETMSWIGESELS